LARVEVVKRNGSFKPQFDQTVQRLDKTQVRVQGFMLPLEVGDRHQQFLLTSVAPSCAFCMAGAPETVVEVVAKQAMRFTTEPVTVAGKLVRLRDDSNGLYYRLVNAAPIVK
jgi:uncharacterized protein